MPTDRLSHNDDSRPGSPYGPDSATVTELYDAYRMATQYFGARSISLSRQQLCKILNTLFWASLRKEEGRNVLLGVLIADPERVLYRCIKLKKTISFSADAIVKISAGLAGTNNLLAVWNPTKGDPYIWGITERLYDGLWLNVSEPGHITVFLWDCALADIIPGTRPRIMRPDEAQHFVIFVREYFGHLIPPGGDNRFGWNLGFLAKAMVHGRGGTILLVDSEEKKWKQSLDFGYEVSTDKLEFEKKSDEFEKASEPLNESEPFDYQFWCFNTPSEINYTSTAKTIGRLTAIDGATVLSKTFVVLGFGAKINSTSTVKTIERIDPVDASKTRDVPINELGGMRHRSAAQFVQDNPGSIAFVASQDGRMTLFGGVNDSRVRAMRCESLLHFLP